MESEKLSISPSPGSLFEFWAHNYMDKYMYNKNTDLTELYGTTQLRVGTKKPAEINLHEDNKII